MSLGLVFKALADETRREILRLLQKSDLTAGEIAARFEFTRPTISHHLSVLKQADLVQDVRKGQNILYSLNITVFQEATAWFIAVLNGKRKETPATEKAADIKEQGGIKR